MKRTLILLFLLASLPFATRAAVDPCLPAKPADQDRLVFQFTPWLNPDEVTRLNDVLVQFARETSNQIAIVVVDSLCGYNASDFAFDLGEAWGLGGAKMDNGIVLLVKPTGGPGERKVFIATGYGLEGAIPDATCRRIVDNEIVPRFKNGDGYGGLNAAIGILMQLAKGEISAKSYGHSGGPSVLLIVGLVLLFIVVVAIAQRNRVRSYASTNNIDFWSAWWLLNQASRSHRGNWGGFSGGGGGGGGFGGFGGGSFGGGGAGGSW